jgi:mannan endo-1,6-alpha-mannosidase
LDIIKGLDVFFKDNVLFEVACEDNGKCNTDQRSFKAYLARFIGYTMIVAPFTVDLLKTRLTTSAVAAAKQCTATGTEATCGLKWTMNGENDGAVGVGENMAALEIVQNLLYDQNSGPVTEVKGGTSKSNPEAGAGANESTTMPVFKTVTGSDKAGAGILTTVVLIFILAGAWWLVS